MAIQHYHYKRKKAITWNWPLTAYVLSDSENVIQQSIGYGSISKFLVFPEQLPAVKESVGFKFTKALNNVLGRTSTLLSTYNITIAVDGLGSLDASSPVKSDIVLAFETGVAKTDVVKSRLNIAKKYKAAGVFLIAVGNIDDLTEWLDQLLIKVSLNKNFIEAISECTRDGTFFYDETLNWHDPLVQAMDTITQNIQLLPSETQIYFENESSLPGDLIKIVNSQKRDFQSLGESGDASLISNLGRAITQYQMYPSPEYKTNFPWFGKFGKKRKTGKDIDFASELEECGNIKGLKVRVDKRDIEQPSAAMPELDEDNIEEEEVFAVEAIAENEPDGRHPDTSPEPAKVLENRRFLQAKINGEHTPNAPVNDHLLINEKYRIEIKIGAKDKTYIIAPGEFPDDVAFDSMEAKEELIQIQFKANGSDLQTAELLLPRHGNSKTVSFDFIVKEKGKFTGEIQAFHKNRLLQRVMIHADVFDKHPIGANTKIELKTVFCARTVLDNLAERNNFGMAIHYDDSGVEAAVSGIRMDKPLLLNTGGGLKSLVNEIKAIIENAAKNIDDYPQDLSHENNVKLLRRLALKGDSLYQHFVGSEDFQGPLQVVAHRAEFVPLNFVYSLKPPKLDAGLCEHAKEALIAGKCRDCFDKNEMPASHICPFGFWGFSKIIEYHKYNVKVDDDTSSDVVVTAEPSSNRDVLHVLQKTIHGSAFRVEAVVSGLRKKVADLLRLNSTTFEVTTWKDWENITRTESPDSIVLIVHVEKNLDYNVNALEIGNKDMLIQNFLSDKHIAQSMRPMAIVIGCEVSDTDNQGFDVGSEFLAKGASIVITNFTKIKGSQAAEIVIKLISFLKESAGKEITFGEIMLKLRQHLLAEGIMVSMSLVSYGDADWKIKI